MNLVAVTAAAAIGEKTTAYLLNSAGPVVQISKGAAAMAYGASPVLSRCQDVLATTGYHDLPEVLSESVGFDAPAGVVIVRVSASYHGVVIEHITNHVRAAWRWRTVSAADRFLVRSIPLQPGSVYTAGQTQTTDVLARNLSFGKIDGGLLYALEKSTAAMSPHTCQPYLSTGAMAHALQVDQLIALPPEKILDKPEEL